MNRNPPPVLTHFEPYSVLRPYPTPNNIKLSFHYGKQKLMFKREVVNHKTKSVDINKTESNV